MFAIEFRTSVRDGIVIVPQEHRDKFLGDVKVILVSEEFASSSPDVIAQLLAHPLQVPGFKPLSRDEVHAR